MAQASVGIETDQRSNELANIVKLTVYLHDKYFETKINDELDVIDIDESVQLSRILRKLYFYMREKNKVNEQNRGTLNGDKEATIANKAFSIDGLYKEFLLMFPTTKFDYKIATPLVNELTSFKCMWDEVGLSYSKFKVRIREELTAFRIDQYQLDNTALPRLKGITWKPERRIGMTETMGPLTLALVCAAETKICDKLFAALKNCIRILPMAEHIIECLRRETIPSYGLHGIFAMLNSILMLTGYPSVQQMHFPLLFFVKSALLDKTNAVKMSYSGADGFIFYNNMAPKFRWQKKSNATAEDISQIVFHAVFGTSVEHFGVLSQITNHSLWKQRKDLNSVFTKADKAPVKQFSSILFHYVFEMECSNLVKNPGNISAVMYPPFFGGRRKRFYTETFLGLFEPGRHLYSYDPLQLSIAMMRFKDSLAAEVRQGRLPELGTTTKWYKINGTNLTETNLVFTSADDLFYS